MKIKHILTLFCVTLTLAFLLVSCAASSEGSNETADNQSNLEWINSITVADVSKENCEHADLSLNCFISVWNTDHGPISVDITGFSEAKIVKLPLVKGGTYDFYVDWGDGEEVEKIEAYDALEVTHNYDESGTYTIHIAGTIKGWRFFTADNSYGDASKLTGVTQWGSLSLGNTAGGQFQGAENFNPTATDAPDLSETTSLSYAFAGAIDFNGAIGNWDVSQITDMKAMFQSASNFNQDISAWDVGEVTSMNGMFYEASSFNNKDGEELDWGDKTSNVTNMTDMFNSAIAFNQDIGGWDVSKVTTMDGMFFKASSFNNNGMVLDWDDKTSNVTDMQEMFNDASDFNQDISDWNVGKVTASKDFATDSGLIPDHTPPKFRDPSTVSEQNCASNPLLRCFISVWKTDHDPTDTTVTGYSGTMSVKLPLVSEGTYDFYVDWGDESDVQKITSSDDATHTYTTKGEYTIHIAGTIKGWRFFVSETNDFGVGVNDFRDAVKLLNVTQWGSLSLGNTAGRQFQGAENFNPTATDAPNLSETTSLVAAFQDATVFNADISDWDVSEVTDIGYMFSSAEAFNNNGKPLDWGNKTSKVTKTEWMFWSAGVFNQDISDWDVGEVTTMNGMFGRATNFNQDISDWDVSKVTKMNSMFLKATSFNNKAAALEWGEKTSAVNNMFMMFNGASAFTQDISGWNVEKVEDAYEFAKESGIENKPEYQPEFIPYGIPLGFLLTPLAFKASFPML